MNENQKINHFYNSVELTRKDRFSDNVSKMKHKHGFYEFDFAPETYQLPEELNAFTTRFNSIRSQLKDPRRKEDDELDNNWIVKPSQSSQGKGIYIIDNIQDIGLYYQQAGG